MPANVYIAYIALARYQSAAAWCVTAASSAGAARPRQRDGIKAGVFADRRQPELAKSCHGAEINRAAGRLITAES